MRTFSRLLRLALLLLSAVLIVLPLLPPSLAGLFYPLCFAAWPLLALDVLALTLSWRSKPWRGAFLLVLLGSLLWAKNYFPQPFRSSAKDQPSGQTLTIVSWNVDNLGTGFQNYTRLPHVSRLIHGQRPDIVCLQERPHTNVISWDSIRAAFADYPYVVINSREDEVLNLVVFSRFPLRNKKEYYFPDTYNKFLSVDCDIDGRTLRIFDVHLQTTSMSNSPSGSRNKLAALVRNAQERNRQADALRAAIAQSSAPVLVCGDFNDIRSSYAYRTVARTLRDLHRAAGKGWGSTYRSAIPLKIDYILAAPSLSPQSSAIHSTQWSDHAMQVGRFVFP